MQNKISKVYSSFFSVTRLIDSLQAHLRQFIKSLKLLLKTA